MQKKENGGIIFKNNYKEKETQPDYKGKIDVKGEEFDIALWIKEGKNGKFFSAQISEPYQKEVEAGYEDAKYDAMKSDNDDLPF